MNIANPTYPRIASLLILSLTLNCLLFTCTPAQAAEPTSQEQSSASSSPTPKRPSKVRILKKAFSAVGSTFMFAVATALNPTMGAAALIDSAWEILHH